MTPVGVVQGVSSAAVAPVVGTRASEPSSALTNRIDKGFGRNPIFYIG
jgi:hypothetical protein